MERSAADVGGEPLKPTTSDEASQAVTFIRDEPAEEDFFQTHSRVAQAVAETIKSNPHVRVVGLLGAWGSGKSTVVRHLSSALAPAGADSKFHVFSYDAWLHQSDPVRRSFLESLLRDLLNEDLTTQADWSARLRELNGRVEDTDILEAPSLTPDAVWMILSIIPVPLGAALIDLDTIKDAFGSDTTKAGIWTFWCAIVLVLLPLWVWATRYLMRRPWGQEKLSSKAFWRQGEDGHVESLLPLFMRQPIRRQTTRTFRSPEPTSIEFGETFNNLMKDVAANGKRMVFVIDNLDRVAENEALQMWATIRGFFLSCPNQQSQETAPHHPVVILPVDTTAIERMFGLTSDPVTAKTLATSFINKTFDVTFQVTQPVMSDWRNFLEQQLRASLRGSISEDLPFATARFFEHWLGSRKDPVTPREINKLINRIAALVLQWSGENIDQEMISYYAVFQDSVDDNIHDFISKPALDVSRRMPDWKRQLAALHFGVPLDKAAQVLTEEPLREAVANLDAKVFESLRDVPGFGETFERLTARLHDSVSEGSDSFAAIANAAILLAGDTGEPATWRNEAWRNLREAYYRVTSLGQITADLSDRVFIFVPHLPADEVDRFVEITAVLLEQALSDEELSVAGLNAAKAAADRLVAIAAERGAPRPTFTIDGDAAFFVARFAAVCDQTNLWPQVRANSPADEVQEALTALFDQPPAFFQIPKVIWRLAHVRGADVLDDVIDWEPLITRAGEVIRRATAAPNPAPSALETLGLLIGTQKAARDALVAVIDEGQIQRHLNEAYASKQRATLANATALLVWRGGDFSAPPGTSWSQILREDVSFLELLYSRLRYFVGLETLELIWVSYDRASSSQHLLGKLIRHVIEKGDLGTIPLRSIMQDLRKYLRPIPWRLHRSFLALLEGYGPFWTRLEEVPLSHDLHEAAKLIARKGPEQAERARAAVSGRVSEASAEAWTAAIRSGSEPFLLATEFLEKGAVRLGVRSALHDALRDETGTICAPSERESRRRWFRLSQLLTPQAEKSAFRAVREAVLKVGGVPALLAVLKSGGLEFLRGAGFEEKPDESVRQIVLPLLRTKEGREWLKHTAIEVRAWISSSSQNTKKEVANRLGQVAKRSGDEAKFSVDVLSESWKVKPK